jgi:hypothetical protein
LAQSGRSQPILTTKPCGPEKQAKKRSFNSAFLAKHTISRRKTDSNQQFAAALFD